MQLIACQWMLHTAAALIIELLGAFFCGRQAREILRHLCVFPQQVVPYVAIVERGTESRMVTLPCAKPYVHVFLIRTLVPNSCDHLITSRICMHP
jgi:hypothetical protein